MHSSRFMVSRFAEGNVVNLSLIVDLHPRVRLFKVAGMIGPGEKLPHPFAVRVGRHAACPGAMLRRRPMASR